MRGHHPLIAIRMRGRCPEGASIVVGIDHSKAWQTWAQMPWLVASIEVQPQDRLSSLAPALRCIVGMLVMVRGTDQDRTEAVAQLAMEAGAKRVFVTVHNPETHEVVSGNFITQEMQQWQPF